MEGTLDNRLAAGRLATGREDERIEEQGWVRASQRGDPLSFNRLVLRWEPAIYNLSLRMLNDPDEAADVAQEVFLSAYRNIGRFRQRARFSTWLYRIAANRCLSRIRRRPGPTAGETDLARKAGVGADSPERDLLEAERRRLVTDALVALEPEQRLVVELKIYQEQTFEEIAAILRLPASTVKSRFYIGLDRLRRRLARTAAAPRGVRP